MILKSHAEAWEEGREDLIVLNDYSMRFPAEIYRFLCDLGLQFMQFIPCLETDPAAAGEAMPFSDPTDEFGLALLSLSSARHLAILGR